MPVDENERTVARTRAKTVDGWGECARAIGAAEATLRGVAEPRDGGHATQDLLQGLCAGRLDILAAHRDEIRSHRRGTADARARDDHFFQFVF